MILVKMAVSHAPTEQPPNTFPNDAYQRQDLNEMELWRSDPACQKAKTVNVDKPWAFNSVKPLHGARSTLKQLDASQRSLSSEGLDIGLCTPYGGNASRLFGTRASSVLR